MTNKEKTKNVVQSSAQQKSFHTQKVVQTNFVLKDSWEPVSGIFDFQNSQDYLCLKLIH